MRKPIFLLLALVFAVPSSPAQTAANPAKRPMTFEDMMHMKRLGETAVSPDGKWLAYSVTTVDLEQNTKTAELWMQAIAGGEAKPLTVGKPGDGGPQFAPDGTRILFLSGRDGWAASVARGLRLGDRRDEQCEEADEHCDGGRQREVVAGWASRLCLRRRCIPTVRPSRLPMQQRGNKCNADRDAARRRAR